MRRRAGFVLNVGEGRRQGLCPIRLARRSGFDNLGVRWMFVWELVRQTKRKTDDAKSTTESR